jgi:hypothetical protein
MNKVRNMLKKKYACKVSARILKESNYWIAKLKDEDYIKLILRNYKCRGWNRLIWLNIRERIGHF